MEREEYRKRAQESSRELLLIAAKVLDAEIVRLISIAKNQQVTERDSDVKFYPERYGSTEVEASEEYALPSLWEEKIIVSERLFDDPETGEARKAHDFSAETLPVDRSSEGIEGPIDIITFLDDSSEVVDVQAKCGIEGNVAGAPAPVLIDIAEALKEANDQGGIEFRQRS